jgi:hypothetical protein
VLLVLFIYLKATHSRLGEYHQIDSFVSICYSSHESKSAIAAAAGGVGGQSCRWQCRHILWRWAIQHIGEVSISTTPK